MYAPRVEEVNTKTLITQSPVPLVGQMFAAVAVAPMGSKDDVKDAKMSSFAINILGTFPTEKEATNYILKSSEAGFNQFDVYVTSVNQFLPMPPPKNVEAHFMQKTVEDFFEDYKKGIRERADRFHKELEDKRLAQEAKEKHAKDGL